MKFEDKYRIIYCKDDYCQEFDNDTFYKINNIEYYKGYLIHRDNMPALQWSSGRKEWYLNGLRHRENGPAIIHLDGAKEWYIKGKLHREDGPAIEWDNGDGMWYLNGKYYDEKTYLKIISFKNKQRVLNDI